MENKQPFMLFPGVESRVIAGIISFTGILILLAWVAINEEARMEEFTDRFSGRSIETGAILYENNCAECHGQLGYGLAGRAPALNNYQLFGYDFFAAYNNQIDALEAELAEIGGSDPERAAQIEAEIAQIQAERQVLEEQLLYDYSDQLEELRAEQTALDTEIVELFGEKYGIVTPALFDNTYTQLEIDKTNLEAERDEINARISAAEEAGEEPDAADATRLDEVFTEIVELENQIDELSPYSAVRSPLVTQVGRYTALEDVHQEVLRLRGEIAAKQTELAALSPAPEEGEDPDAETRLSLGEELDALETQLVDQETIRDNARQELIDAGDIVAFDPERPDRLHEDELNWQGGIRTLLRTTIISGRPTSNSYWDTPMAAWSVRAGGPLRDDQIENLVDYILNWDREFTVADVHRIQQYAVIPSADVGGEVEDGVGTDLDAILAQLDELEAAAAAGELEEGSAVPFDSTAGQQSFQRPPLNCTSCHVAGGGGAGPDMAGIFTRAEQYAAENDDISDARYYLVQSIVQPGAFIVDTYTDAMPPNFGERIDLVTMSNIIAYLESLDN